MLTKNQYPPCSITEYLLYRYITYFLCQNYTKLFVLYLFSKYKIISPGILYLIEHDRYYGFINVPTWQDIKEKCLRDIRLHHIRQLNREILLRDIKIVTNKNIFFNFDNRCLNNTLNLNCIMEPKLFRFFVIIFYYIASYNVRGIKTILIISS